MIFAVRISSRRGAISSQDGILTDECRKSPVFPRRKRYHQLRLADITAAVQRVLAV
jgi:hypothetical protein